jgi:4'-phosphopantetheinyl transferase
MRDLEIVFADLDASQALLHSEEASTPRLSPSDRLRLERLSGAPDRQALWRLARIATRIVLERRIGPDIRGADFAIATGGRPSLGEGLPQFNVSHTESVVLIAVCASSPVGVDIERERNLQMSLERRRRIVSAAAGFAGTEASDPQSDADVLRAWVRLEAIAKARGSGIGVLLTEEGVIGSPAEKSRKLLNPSPVVKSVSVPAPFIAAIAADALPDETEVIRFPSGTSELQDFLRR